MVVQPLSSLDGPKGEGMLFDTWSSKIIGFSTHGQEQIIIGQGLVLRDDFFLVIINSQDLVCDQLNLWIFF